MTVTPSDREEVLAFVETFTLEERMLRLIEWHSGRIHAEIPIKKGLILQAIGGVSNEYSESSGNIHLLLVGDPGTAKTKLLELAAKLHPQSRFVNAESTSQAGLTAACLQTEDMYTNKKQWALTPGALALTHKDAVCAVDELNLYPGSMGDFNSALESGYVYVNKVVKGKVITDCSVIAGCNPDNGNKKKWIRGEQLSYMEQLGLDFTLTQRFAGIFVLEDIPDMDRDTKISLAMTKGITEGEDTVVDPDRLDFIRKYIAMAKENEPLLTPAAAKYIAKEHARKRSENQGGSDSLRSHRQVNALSRLTTAVAKFDFAQKATMNHVRYAESILAETLQEKDPGLFNTGKTLSERELEDECKEHITLYFESLSPEAKQKVHHVDDVHAYVCDNLGGGWRTPSKLEVSHWVAIVADKDAHIESMDSDRYIFTE